MGMKAKSCIIFVIIAEFNGLILDLLLLILILLLLCKFNVLSVFILPAGLKLLFLVLFVLRPDSDRILLLIYLGLFQKNLYMNLFHFLHDLFLLFHFYHLIHYFIFIFFN